MVGARASVGRAGVCPRCRVAVTFFSPGDRCADGALLVDAVAFAAGDGDPLLGFELGGWSLFGKLGEGESCAVYEGVDAAGHLAALKVVRTAPEYGGFASTAASSLMREAGLLERVDPSAGAPRRLGVGRTEHLLYLALERIFGTPLDRSGPLTLAAGRAVAVALAQLHLHGVVHGDLKPSNVLLLSSGSARLVDFGAGALAGQVGAPEEDSFTPAFAAPERGRLGPTKASDVFALGRVLAPLGRDLTLLVATTQADQPEERPSAAEVVAALGRIAPDM